MSKVIESNNYNEDVTMIIPSDGMVDMSYSWENLPYNGGSYFTPRIYFNKNIKNVSIAVGFDTGIVDEDFIEIEEVKQQDHWYWHLDKSTFKNAILIDNVDKEPIIGKPIYVLSWRYNFDTFPTVDFIITYDTDTETGKEYRMNCFKHLH